MPTKLITKNSSTASAVPTAGQLDQGELAVNVTDKRLFTKDSGGTVRELGTNPTSITTGAVSGTTGQFSTSLNVDGTVTADGLTVDGASTITQATDTPLTIAYNGSNSSSYGYYQIVNNNTGNPFEIHTGGSKTLRLEANGDVSLYEDTGTTAKFFWDASAESLGIGTTSPSSTYGLDLTKGIRISSVLPNVTLEESDASNHVWQLGSYGGNFSIRDVTHGSYPFTVADGGNVGIGTSSPDRPLEVVATNTTMKVTGAGVSSTGIVFETNGVERKQIGIPSGSTALTFYSDAGTTQAMTLDSSGNLLVGTTDGTPYASNVKGAAFYNSGAISGSVDGLPAMYLNRKTSDGTIADFRKDGTTVGSIGANASRLLLGTGNAGLIFDSSAGSIEPRNVTTGTATSIDLGNPSGSRFKDLYLSGGVYLGGTGVANNLNDYETGTWTPIAASGMGSFTVQNATYTKIGRIVYVSGWLSGMNTPTVSSFTVGGLPFTSANPEYGHIGRCLVYGGNNTSGADSVYLSANSTSFVLTKASTTGSSPVAAVSGIVIGASSNVQFSIIYEVD